MINRLLVVDDEELNLQIIQESLEESGYILDLVKSGKDALEKIHSFPHYSAIILDRLMPEMDGLEVLKRIKSNPDLQEIPVILQTALGNTEHIEEGLEAGAFYYLTKPFSRKVLLSVIKTAVESFNRYKKAKSELSKNKALANYIEELSLKIQTYHDMIEIAPMVSNLFPNPKRALTGIIEILNNSIEHGNLEIGFEKKQKLMENNLFSEYVNDLIKKEPYCFRYVTIHLCKAKDKTSMVVTDEGLGFDYNQFMKSTTPSNNLFQANGRGILIAKSICFDKLEYQGKGNIVLIESFWT